ncbi:MAG TPA: biotin synthase BioB [Candidatus Baltobacteraceae bacterium]|nr:biotin synthase BioB [Candidatus Baltobacteraceae bacterium]
MNFAKLSTLYHQPLFDLISQSRAVHLQYWHGEEVQRCSLLSIKTGGCSEDCAYCAQSSHYSTGVEREDLLSLENVLIAARRARSQGATRFCMGAAWRGVRDGSEKFERVLEIVREVSQLDMEVCVTLGEIGPVEARKLKTAGVTAYNHNIDTSPEFYSQIVSTHTFQNRLNTIAAVQESGMSVCCGGIIGMGESEADRLRMLEVLSNFDPPPESVPINCLMAMPGTPLADQPPVDIFELVRLIAVTRIALPKARVRLAAGRTRISREGQALCFFAGANSIFYGDKLLTAKNPAADVDVALLRELGMHVESMSNDECLITKE